MQKNKKNKNRNCKNITFCTYIVPVSLKRTKSNFNNNNSDQIFCDLLTDNICQTLNASLQTIHVNKHLDEFDQHVKRQN